MASSSGFPGILLPIWPQLVELHQMEDIVAAQSSQNSNLELQLKESH